MKSLNFNKLNLQKEDFLHNTQMKQIWGGYVPPGGGPNCGTGDTYCGQGSGITCCPGYTCEDAGNGQNPGVPGGDKLCD